MSKITIKLDGDDSALVAALNRVIRKEEELGRAAASSGKASRKAGKGAQSAYSEMGDALESVALKFGPLAVGAAAMTAGYRTALDVLKSINAETDRLAQKQASASGGLRQLAQLGGGDPGKVRELTAQSREFLAAGGAGDLDQAAATIFQLESASINTAENRAIFAKLGGVVGDPAGFAKSARTLQASVGEEETGGIPGILSKAMAASAESPAPADALLKAAALSGAFAGNLGISDEELLAATAISAEKAGGAAAGGRNVKGFLKAIALDPEAARAARDGGIAGAIQNIQARELSGQVAFGKVFGTRAESFQGFTQLAAGEGPRLNASSRTWQMPELTSGY